MLLYPRSCCFKKSWSLSAGSKTIAAIYMIFAGLVLSVLSLALINIDTTSRQLFNMRNWTEIPLLVANSLIFPEHDTANSKKKQTAKSIGNITNKRTAKVLTNVMSSTVGNTEESIITQNYLDKKESTQSKKNENKKFIKDKTARINLSEKLTLKVPEIESTTTQIDSIIKEESTKSIKNKNKSVRTKTAKNLSNNSTIKVPEIEENSTNNGHLMSKSDFEMINREKLVKQHELTIPKLGKNRNSKRTGSKFPDESTTTKYNQADLNEFGLTIFSKVDETMDPEESFDKIEKEFKRMKIEKHLGNSSLNSLRNTEASYHLENSLDDEVPKSPNSKKKSVKKAKTIFAYLKGSLILAITLAGIYLSSCILLMIGILKRSAKLVAPWVLIEFWRQLGALFIWVCLTYHTINALAKTDFINNVKILFLIICSVILVTIALNFYLWLVICSFYNELHGTGHQSLSEENKKDTSSMRITDLWAQPPTFLSNLNTTT